ncbi:MAG: hypothetical protein QM751_03955 [Paludibacteraceae bacterium]
MKVLNNSFLAFFDTGYFGGIGINSIFYENNKIDFPPLIKQTNGVFFGGGCSESSKFTNNTLGCNILNININDKNITLGNDCSVSINGDDNSQDKKNADGVLGNNIFKYVKSASLDFKNMSFEIIYY